MAIIKEEEVKESKILKGTAFSFRLSDTQEEKYKNMVQRNANKASLKIAQQIQRQMRKHTSDIIKGAIYDEDFNEIFEEVRKIIVG